MDKKTIKKNLNYYISNQDSIIKNYQDKYVVIRNERIEIVADSWDEAFIHGFILAYRLNEDFLDYCIIHCDNDETWISSDCLNKSE